MLRIMLQVRTYIHKIAKKYKQKIELEKLQQRFTHHFVASVSRRAEHSSCSHSRSDKIPSRKLDDEPSDDVIFGPQIFEFHA